MKSLSISLAVLLAVAGCAIMRDGIEIRPDSWQARVAKSLPHIDPMFAVPEGSGTKAALEVPAPMGGLGISELATVRAVIDAVKPMVPPTINDSDRRRLVAEFLHVADAQLRDQVLYDDYESQRSLGVLDGVVSVSVRKPLVERLDTLTLAATLGAYAKADGGCHEGKRPRFIIHGGDLLDISVATELIDGLSVFREVQQQTGCAIMSVGGNHDGLTFGNFTDKVTDTRGLGVNRSEFVAAHLFADAKCQPIAKGFGMGCNEILSRLKLIAKKEFGEKDQCLATDEWDDCTANQIDDLNDQRRRWETARTLSPLPAVFQKAIAVSGTADASGQQIGYYAFDMPRPAGAVAQQPIRAVVLDTRSPDRIGGVIDPVQLGWIFNELAASRERAQPVVLFGHHAIDQLVEGREPIERMLKWFHHVAAYFYGHDHWNVPSILAPDGEQRRPFFVQTGSLADFPQVGRQVQILSAADTTGGQVEFRMQFVRARGTDKADGTLLESLLDASLHDARKEHDKAMAGLWCTKPRGLLTIPWAMCAAEGSQEAPILGGIGRWNREHLGFEKSRDSVGRTQSASVTIAFDGAPTPVSVFGRKMLETIDKRREALLLRKAGDSTAHQPEPCSTCSKCTSSVGKLP